jgi:hypothetical protein
MKKLFEKLFNISRADLLLVAATVVAALRMMLIHAVFIGFDLAQWPWFKGVEVGSGLAFAVLEGVALAYVSRLWVGLRPQRRTEWVYWGVLALGQLLLLASIIGVTAYAAASVRRGVTVDLLLGNGAAIAWSMFVTALNPLMVILIGIARAIDPREQQPTGDRPMWPPLEVQLELFVKELAAGITPDEAAKRFEALTGTPIAIRTVAGALARRNSQALAVLSARVNEPVTGDGVQGETVQEGAGSEAITIRSAEEQAGEPVQPVLDQATRRARVREMHGQGVSQAEMARRLGVNASTVRRDLRAVLAEAEAVRGNGKVREKVV